MYRRLPEYSPRLKGGETLTPTKLSNYTKLFLEVRFSRPGYFAQTRESRNRCGRSENGDSLARRLTRGSPNPLANRDIP